MEDQNSLDIEIFCQKFASAFNDMVTWKWDDRFQMALTEFDVSDKNGIKVILESFLKISWDNSNIDNAPSNVKLLINKFGGLKSGQLVFLEDTNREDFLYCVWWPWGNGNKISIRVAPSINQLSDVEIISKFKVSFKI